MFNKIIRKKTQTQPQKESKSNKKWDKLDEKLKGSKFRLLNEYLYTVGSKEANQHFVTNPDEFSIYHQGYKSQIEKWPESPAQNIIQLLRGSEEFQDKKLIISDLGCGVGEIQEYFIKNPHSNIKKINSFDFIASKPFIKQADISELPLKNDTQDMVIYSLSLMGTNYLDYLAEGFRVLKLNGYIIIAEVKSRMPDINSFINLVKGMGCKILKRDEHNTHFALFIFQKIQNDCAFQGYLKQKDVFQILGHKDPNITDWGQLAQQILKPCVYKKR